MLPEMKSERMHSVESEIDDVLEVLLGKMLSDGLTAKEQAQYDQLLIERSRLMRPVFLVHRSARYAA
jgi:hypothetical protein